jgi:hypothetical protein
MMVGEVFNNPTPKLGLLDIFGERVVRRVINGLQWLVRCSTIQHPNIALLDVFGCFWKKGCGKSYVRATMFAEEGSFWKRVCTGSQVDTFVTPVVNT